MSGTFVDNISQEHGALHSDGVRYVLVRADGLMGCFKSELHPASLEMYSAIEDSFCRFGGRSAQQYADQIGSDPRDLLLKIENMAPQLGWGEWTFSLNSNEKKVILTVENSPFSAGYGHANFAVCAPISGMLKGVAERVFKQAVTCEERRCSAMDSDICQFEAVVEAVDSV